MAFLLAEGASARVCAAQRLAFAPDPRRAITQYRHDVWTTDHGLPQASVVAMLQSRDGYLWLGTEEGLVRFDGLKFTVFNRYNTPALRNHDVQALAEAADGSLWIGTAHGLYRRRDGILTPIAPGALGGHLVGALLADSAGLWVGTRGLGLSRLEGDTAFTYPAGSLPSPYVTALARDHGGTLWIGTRAGLATRRGDAFSRPRLHAALDSAYVYGLHVDRAGRLWIGTNGSGLFRLDSGRVTRYTRADGLPWDMVTQVLEDSEGTVWIGTNGGGLSRFREGRFETFNEAAGLSGDIVASLWQDREGNLWVGTKGGGLNRFRNTRFTPLGRPEGLSHDIALAVYQDRAGAMWIGTAGGGVNRLHRGRVTIIDADDGLPADVVLSIHQDGSGDHWFGTIRGLVRWRDGIRRVYTTRDGLPSNIVNDVLDDGAGGVWIGTRSGIARITDAGVQAFGGPHGLTNEDVLSLHDDGAGGLYIGTGGGGLFRFRNGAFTPLGGASPELSRASVEGMHRDSAGVLWLATMTGLFRYERERVTHFTRAQGLFSEVVFAVVDDGRGGFWMCGNEGMSRVPRADLEAVAAGRAARVATVAFGTSAGMRSRECNGGVQPAGMRDADGRVWFPTMRGPVIVDPANLEPNTAAPLVQVEAVTVNDRETLLAGDRLRLAAGVARLTIHYTGLSLGAAEDVTYRYRLEEYDEAWIEAGGRREAFYTRLPPGSYTFRVMAANGDGVWSDNAAALAFTVAPFFYQRLSVRLLAVLSLLGAAAGLYQRRGARHRARVRELMERIEERARAQAALAASERRYRNLFEEAHEIVITTDAQGHVSTMNRKAEELLGETRDVVRGRPLSALIAGETDGFERARRAGGTSALQLRSGSGAIVPVEVSIQEIRDDDALTGYQLIARDLTERDRLEERLRQAHKMEAIGRLAGGIAHDFNNLLTVLLGASDNLLQGLAAGDPLRREAEESRGTALRAAQLTRQLLAFSRQQVLEAHLLDLQDTVAAMEGMLRRLIGEDIELVLSQCPGIVPVRADPGQLQQVILNLAVNARDAMPRGGRLTIQTARVDLAEPRTRGATSVGPGRYAVVTVSDTGTGMDEKTVARLFEPFFTTKVVGQGTGLGLATVYGIIRQSGGEVVVESTPGVGTTFEIYLPLAEEPVVKAREPEQRAQGGSETILLVEDEPALLALAQRLLQRNGYRVIAAESGTAALERAGEHQGPIDLLVTDVVMPRLSGRELATRLRQVRPGLRVLYLSGYTADEVIRHGVEQQQVSFLQKPFSLVDLTRKVREVLDQPAGVDPG